MNEGKPQNGKQTTSDSASDNAPTRDGNVKATDKSYGFLETSNGDSFFIPPAEMRKVFPGDRITARIIEDKQGRKQAFPSKLITPYITSNVGRIFLNPKDKNFYVDVDAQGYREKIFAKVPNAIRQLEPKDGDWVKIGLGDHPLEKSDKKASLLVKELIAHADDPKIPWLVSLKRYDLPVECPPDPVSLEQFEHHPREDLREIPFVTIDSPSTRDMDDAVCIEDRGDYWTLYVAIADPTSFIESGSPMDKEAASRAFTCYLPGFNIPIIPHVMSEGVCSLMEGEDRPALVARINVAKDGSLYGDEPCAFSIATVRSRARLAYDDVSDFLENGKSDNLNPDPWLVTELTTLQEFSVRRAKQRSKTTVLFKDKPDYEIELDENGSPAGVKVEYRRGANKIVEECMIIANECAGDFLAEKLGRGIFNRHTGFDSEKLDLVLKHLSRNGITDATKEELGTMEGFFRIRSLTDQQPTGYLDMRLRKFYIPAEVVGKPAEHFGLGLKNYATWTSPIRKYGDMINHRLIKSVITGAPLPAYDEKEVLATLNQIKKVNRYAERDVNDWLYMDILEPEIEKGTEFEAEICDITQRGGVKAQLLANGASVFIPFQSINENKAPEITQNSDEGRIYNNGKVMYELAMKITVRLKSIDRTNRNITAEIVS
ncbi:MAG: exoribonuclease II [Succinivibrionaceae bacterium]|nr:exoribonuclease II [Succinivibrionaceae bacterium]